MFTIREIRSPNVNQVVEPELERGLYRLPELEVEKRSSLKDSRWDSLLCKRGCVVNVRFRGLT